jgi:hypothetical protein
VIWTAVFLVLVGVAFSLKVAENLSRGSALAFFALGLGGMIACADYSGNCLDMRCLRAPSPRVTSS